MNTLAGQTAQIGDVVALTVKFIDSDGDVIDLSAATEKFVILRYPDGSSIELEASFVTDGTDGLIEYVTADNDLTVKGTYYVEGRVVIADSPLSTRNNNINNTLYVYSNV